MMPVGSAVPQEQLHSCLFHSLAMLHDTGANSQFIFFLFVSFFFQDRFLSFASKGVLMVAKTILITDTGG